jgi:uncharacterized Zn finger protein (UPF0148 family)
MSDTTIFEQDGVVYCALCHSMPTKDLARETAREIREMAKVPRAKMKVVSTEEFRKMPFGKPKSG